ncbi:MAG: crotonase/enoyl-CoA hydratase family protein [Polyangia bacterium]|jgi:enoyl-CoA hydratase|nr:crotonase/enoyl-CoA hydratase family protein [Polyangia bacterium]
MSECYETIRVERDGNVAEVALYRPEKGNAMNAALFAELERAFGELDADDSVRAVILRGEGKAFCYGLDLMAAPVDFPPVLEEGLAFERLALRQLILELQRQCGAPAACRKPVIAAVHGYCIGGGLDLISACDLRLCSADATFSLREARVAMVADLGSLQRLPRIIGDAATRELAFTAKDIGAQRALALGLVSQVLEDRDALMACARAEAAAIAKLSPVVTRGIKQVLGFGEARRVAEGLNYVATWNAAFLQSEDLKEAIGAFLERRDPVYKGR